MSGGRGSHENKCRQGGRVKVLYPVKTGSIVMGTLRDECCPVSSLEEFLMNFC